MYFNCFEPQVRPGPGGGGQILFKPPYRSVLMGGSRGGNSECKQFSCLWWKIPSINTEYISQGDAL